MCGRDQINGFVIHEYVRTMNDIKGELYVKSQILYFYSLTTTSICKNRIKKKKCTEHINLGFMRNDITKISTRT